MMVTRKTNLAQLFVELLPRLFDLVTLNYLPREVKTIY